MHPSPIRIKHFQKNRVIFCFLHKNPKPELCFFTTRRNTTKPLCETFPLPVIAFCPNCGYNTDKKQSNSGEYVWSPFKILRKN